MTSAPLKNKNKKEIKIEKYRQSFFPLHTNLSYDLSKKKSQKKKILTTYLKMPMKKAFFTIILSFFYRDSKRIN